MITIAVVDVAGARAADAAAIAAGTPSRALMLRAGAAAAAEIASRFADQLDAGVVIATGPGNNGGDGWVVAQALHAVGIPVRVVECSAARSADAVAERALAAAAGVLIDAHADALGRGAERVVVDALLGTGVATGRPLENGVAAGVAQLRERVSRGAVLVALDLPSGLDATTGAYAGVTRAALTLVFGTIKRGHLVARDVCGTIVLLDIGLGAHAAATGAAHLVTDAWFRATLPVISANAHKGTRGKVAVVGGGVGMAGAAMLAARGALRSGAGMVKCVVADESLHAVQKGEPAALAASWRQLEAAIKEWPDVLLIGPGLGGEAAREIVERALQAFGGPVVLDADALNAFAGDTSALRAAIGVRRALLTPHSVEFGRLAGITTEEVLERRFDAPRELAARTGAAVLLKGVPTVIASVDGLTYVVAEGTPVLATGGSGDVLGGIAATLLAQTNSAVHAGALAAFAHGRAAAAVSARQVRGYTLDDVLVALPGVWSLARTRLRPPVLCELPAVGEAP